MSVRALTVLAPLLLGGCALPVPIQIASWALDGASLFATGKSVTDHGLSAVAQEDCAMWRVATTGEVCIDGEGGGIAVADLDDASPVPGDPGGVGAEAEAWVLAAAVQPAGAEADAAEDAAAFVTAASYEAPDTAATPADRAAAQPTTEPGAAPVPAVGLYYVIGSFARRTNAEALAGRHTAFGAGIVEARVEGRLRHRVVVGPMEPAERAQIRRRLGAAGLAGVWPLRLRGVQVATALPRTGRL